MADSQDKASIMYKKKYLSNKSWLSKNNFIKLSKIVFVTLVSLRLSLLPHDLFKDRANYLMRINTSETQFYELFNSKTPILLNEPLFKVLNYILSFNFNPEFILSSYVFINCFFVLTFVLINRNSISHSLLALALLLVMPYFYGGTLGAIRQGLGLNLILISLMKRDHLLSIRFLFSLFLASLFHVIFFVFLALTLSYKIIRKITNNEKYVFSMILLCIIAIGTTWRLITPFLSSTQNYYDFEQNTSGITFIGWFIITIIFIYNYFYLKKTHKLTKEYIYIFTILMLICFLVFYWLAPGPYRILYSCSPLLACSLLNHFNKYSALCYSICFFYCFLLLLIGAGAGSMNVNFNQFITIVFTFF